METKRLFFLSFGIFLLIVLFLQFCEASAPPPAPDCYVKGIIQEVEFNEAYNNPCIQNPPCPSDAPLHYPDRYSFLVLVQEVSYFGGDISYQTCEEMCPLDSEVLIFLNKEDVKEGDFFNKNQRIEGKVVSFWGKSFESYFLEDSTKPNEENNFIIIIIAIIVLIIIFFLVLKKKK